MIQNLALFIFLCSVASSLGIEDAGEPVYVTKYLPHDPKGGQNACRVPATFYPIGSPSYSCYFTLPGSKLSAVYFWYFEALNVSAREDAPTILWLQGGPGASSLFGLFSEIGPFSVNGDGTLHERDVTWNENYNLLFIDNPLGVGYSFTEDEARLCRNEECVAKNLYDSLQQFFELFPPLRKNPFYIGVESYGGKYGTHLAYYIHQKNKESQNPKIPLVGLSIGDGALNPSVQFGERMADLFYFMSLCDHNQREHIKQECRMITSECNQHKYIEAFHRFDSLLNGDFWRYGTYFYNITGLQNYFNVIQPKYEPNPWVDFLAMNSTKKALHVGNNPFWGYNSSVEAHLIGDWMRDVDHILPTLLQNYDVMIYNGQLDLILGTALTEEYLLQLEWHLRHEYDKAERTMWKFNGSVQGYARSVGNFRHVTVLDAGHEVPRDNPIAAMNMINRFIQKVPFSG